jgi:glucose/arabinose dehydrogenase
MEQAIGYCRLAAGALLIGASCALGAVDLGTYKGCAADDGQFKQTKLWTGPAIGVTATSNGALKLAFVSQPDGAVDVYFIQKQGAVKRYNGKTGTVDSLGTIPVDFGGEYGLVGIGTRADFLKNPWLYLYGSFLEADGSPTLRLFRMKLNAGLNALDKPTEKVLLKFPRTKSTFHSAGDIQFDAYDDLWLSVGDNGQTETGPGNTADLRGNILRIHPDESDKGYGVPKGNFAETFAAYWKAQGKPDLAAQYADPAKVKPEIYVKGNRNPYTITLDPVRRWLTWGDVGPDQQRVSEEHNIVKQPFYTGWPYFAGEEDMAGQNPYGTPIPAGSTRAAPMNKNAAAGVAQLPPNHEPIFARQQGCAMTGPIFRYDGSIANAGQFPPQFNRKWLISGCDGYGYHLVTLDSAGEKILSNVQIFKTIGAIYLVDLKQGPDGALYYVSWSTGLYKIEYTGACRDAGLLPEKTGCATAGAPNYDPSINPAYHDPRLCGTTSAVEPTAEPAPWLHVDGRSVSVSASGWHVLTISDMRGRVLHRVEGAGAMTYALPSFSGTGLYQVRVVTARGSAVRMLPRL